MERQPLKKSIENSWRINSAIKMPILTKEALIKRDAEFKMSKRKEQMNNAIFSKRKETMEDEEAKGIVGEEEWKEVTRLREFIRDIQERTIKCEESKRMSNQDLINYLENIEGEMADLSIRGEKEVIKCFSPKFLGYLVKMLPEKDGEDGEDFEAIYYPLSFIDDLLLLEQNIKALVDDESLMDELLDKIDKFKGGSFRFCELSISILDNISSYLYS